MGRPRQFPMGARSRFDQTAMPHLPALYQLARQLAGADKADDLVQDTYLRAWKHFDRFAPGTNFPAVVNFERYHELLVDNLRAKGYCAIFDSEEIQVKRENRFSEHYDVHLGDGYVRRGEGAYRSTCWPAAF